MSTGDGFRAQGFPRPGRSNEQDAFGSINASGAGVTAYVAVGTSGPQLVLKGQDGAATGYWVGESKGIPASKADFSTVSLTPLKVAALAVASMELLRDSTPAAEQLIRDALVAAVASNEG